MVEENFLFLLFMKKRLEMLHYVISHLVVIQGSAFVSICHDTAEVFAKKSSSINQNVRVVSASVWF